MTTVAALLPPQGGKSAPSAGVQPASTPAGLRGSIPARIDFRSLLREQALAREASLAIPISRPTGVPSAAHRPALSAKPGEESAASDPALVAWARDEDDGLDPFSRHHASLAPPDALFSTPSTSVGLAAQPFALSPTEAGVAARAAGSLEHLWPALVRRVAWSGDGRKGTMRLELGAGALAGATLLVHSDAGRVRVHLEVPTGVDTADWQRRILERLEGRGIPTDGVEVT